MPGIGFLAGILALAVSGSVLAETHQPGEVNLALGKPYTLTPAPNYGHCTDPGRTRLTDGIKAGANWTRESTVGWTRGTEEPIIITIDLQRVEAIDEIRFHSLGGGRGGVFLPSLLVFMVSDDGREFHIVTTLYGRTLEPKVSAPADTSQAHTLRATDMRTRGRYVRIIPYPRSGSCVFIDEVEVIPGQHDPQGVRFDPQDRLYLTQVPALFAAHRFWLRTCDELDQLDGILAEKQGAQVDEESAAWRKRISDGMREAEEFPVHRPEPLKNWHARVRSLRGEWLKRKWNRPLLWKQADPMEQIRPNDVFFSPSEENTEAKIELWQREYEPLAITLVNGSPDPVELEVAVSLITNQTGQTFDPYRAITLRRAWYVETRPEWELLGDALIRITDGRLSLEAGSAGQLWLTFHDPELPAGRYSFGVRLRNPSRPHEQETIIPVNVTVHPIVFPERVALRTYNWAYLSRMQLTDEQIRWVVRDLKSHYTNVIMLPSQDRPIGQVYMGSLRMDFRQHDRALYYYPDAETYLFLFGCSPEQPDGFGQGRWGPYMSDSWKHFFQSYLNQWVEHLARRGIGYDRFALYPYDESLCEEFLQLAKFIKEVDPKIRIFANSHQRSKKCMAIDHFTDYVDIWCLNDDNPQAQAARNKLKNVTHKEGWRYKAFKFAKSLSPYTYYRLQPWRAWASDEIGSGFWVYMTRRDSTTGADCSVWDDFDCTGKGSWRCDAVYTGRDAPADSGGEVFIPSRRWEIWREGVEDYQYLHTLSQRIRTAREQGTLAQLVQEAEAVLEQVVAGVLGHTDQPGRLDDARRRTTESILRLDAAMTAGELDR
ncbi:MAG: hypothetical protein GXY44_00885 [Phycisphaerales bacterium]|nr:hypothetical protein [Phycisphaerales bacterium]